MPSITNGIIRVDFSITGKDASGNFTISATFKNTSSSQASTNTRMSISLTDAAPWSHITVGTINAGATKVGSITISSGSQASQNVYCYLVHGSSSTGPGGAYNVPGYSPPTPPTPQYSISYNANGGTGAPSGQSVNQGSQITLRAEQPTRTGFRFVGWNTKADGTGTMYQPSQTFTPTSNLTLYAQWSSGFRVVQDGQIRTTQTKALVNGQLRDIELRVLNNRTLKQI